MYPLPLRVDSLHSGCNFVQAKFKHVLDRTSSCAHVYSHLHWLLQQPGGAAEGGMQSGTPWAPSSVHWAAETPMR